MSAIDGMTADARLVILQELARQTDARLNDRVLVRVLDTYGMSRTRDWTRTQLRALAALDAVALAEAGELLIATLRQAGRDHVDRRGVIEGVSPPADVA